ncbi:MAG: toxin-antitoxin system YwqK family antitoxin [Polaribacter sp.]|uniref:toxin-antitoxin system YwqK family antitoxin n=1 Tax=Polaribacter sp. TaxID=1920175 RepID=UPI003BB03B8C
MLNIKRVCFVLLFFSCFFSGLEFNAQKINQFDANKKRTGIWKKYYPNDKIRYEGEFKNGKEIGVFKFYDISDSGNPTIIKTFSDKNDTVAVSFFSLKGKLQTKGFFINKLRVGEWKYFFPDGKIMSEEFYKEDKLEGKLINYYPNGKETEISIYKNGLKHGVSQKYSSDGILIEEVTFSNDKPNGLAKYFELNGNLKESGTYKDGKRVGKWEYYLDGEVADKKEVEKSKEYIKNEK